MVVSIQVEEQTVEALNAQAQAHGLSLEAYLRSIADNGYPSGQPPMIDMAEFDRWLDELSEGAEHIPSLPLDFSRADVYADHD